MTIARGTIARGTFPPTSAGPPSPRGPQGAGRLFSEDQIADLTPAQFAEFFQSFANLLADTVEAELTTRKIPHLASEQTGIAAFRHIDRNPGPSGTGTPGIYQVTLLEAWPDSAPQMPAREFLYKYVRRWAANIAIKLARTGVLTTYPMELPKAVDHAAIGTTPDLTLRCIVDYSMHDDLQVLRIDALAGWDE
jgi:hypothetical protein